MLTLREHGLDHLIMRRKGNVGRRIKTVAACLSSSRLCSILRDPGIYRLASRPTSGLFNSALTAPSGFPINVINMSQYTQNDSPPHKPSNHGAEEIENVLKPTPSHFEKLYLAPEQAVAGKLRLTFANPTPMYVYSPVRSSPLSLYCGTRPYGSESQY